MLQGKRAGRWLLVLTYALTTALIDAGHRHGPDDATSAKCQAACRAPGAHLSGHSSPDLQRVHHDCPACHVRSLQIAPPTSIRLLAAPRRELAATPWSVPFTTPLQRSHSVRGPPRSV